MHSVCLSVAGRDPWFRSVALCDWILRPTVTALCDWILRPIVIWGFTQLPLANRPAAIEGRCISAPLMLCVCRGCNSAWHSYSAIEGHAVLYVHPACVAALRCLL